MKKLVAKFFIAVVVLTGIPDLGFANSSLPTGSTPDYYDQFRLTGRSIHTHRIYLSPGRSRIMVSGDGDTDLDLYIYDSEGLIGRAESNSDDEIIPITVYRGGYFTIKVVNRGKVYNDYTLAVQ